MEEEKEKVVIKAASKPRSDLYLKFYYPAVDPYMENSWVKVLSPKTFVAWLQLQTMVDRSGDAYAKYDNMQTVPRSLKSLMEFFGMSKPKFYRVVIKPLWDYGLIDLVQWDEHKKIGQKALNIVVYEYPLNDFNRQNKPLEKLRDYDTDYQSNARVYASRRKQTTPSMQETFEHPHVRALLYLANIGIKQIYIDQIANLLMNYKDVHIQLAYVGQQLLYMSEKIARGEQIYDFPQYFVNGLINLQDIGESVLKFSGDSESSVVIREQVETRFEGYNWLENRA